MTCIKDYLRRSVCWGEKGQNQHVLSNLKPEKEIYKSTLVGWVKVIIKKIAMGIYQYRTYSCCFVISSKAKVMAVSFEEVLKREYCSGDWT